MKYSVLILTIGLLCCSMRIAQADEREIRKEQMQNNSIMRLARSPLRNQGDEATARNLLILKEVLDFKMGDESLQEYFIKVEKNRNYYKKMDKIMKELDNSKRRNTKNNQIIQILNEAGNKIYNLLGN